MVLASAVVALDKSAFEGGTTLTAWTLESACAVLSTCLSETALPFQTQELPVQDRA